MKTKYAIILATVVGFALGAAAIQGLHAQVKPLGYVVAEITVTNQEAYAKEYGPPIVKTIQDFGGKFLARGGKTSSLAGDPPKPRVAVVQFESLDKAQAWFNSPATQALAPIGEKYATFRTFVVEGVSP